VRWIGDSGPPANGRTKGCFLQADEIRLLRIISSEIARRVWNVMTKSSRKHRTRSEISFVSRRRPGDKTMHQHKITAHHRDAALGRLQVNRYRQAIPRQQARSAARTEKQFNTPDDSTFGKFKTAFLPKKPYHALFTSLPFGIYP